MPFPNSIPLAVIALLATSACGPRVMATRSQAPACAARISTDTTVYAASDVSPKPAVRTIPPGRYPPELAIEVSHVVDVEVVVHANGQIDSASVQRVRSTEPRLDSIAIRMVLGSTWWPGCRADSAVATRVVQRVRFGGPTAAEPRP
jgi:hypothetical protein